MTGPVGVADADEEVVLVLLLTLELPDALDELELVDCEVVPLGVDDTDDDVLLPDTEDDELDDDKELDDELLDVETEVEIEELEDTVLELTVVEETEDDEDDEEDPGTVPSAGLGTYLVRS